MHFDLRQAAVGDGPACAAIIRAWGAETPWMAPLDDLDPMGAFWDEMIAEHPAWVAESNAKVVGFCLREDDIGNIGGLYVDGGARGHGVGKALLDRAKLGWDRLVVWAYEANTEARRFYAREGFIEICYEVEEESGLMNIEHHWTRTG